MEDRGHIHSIESFGTVDGPGVRFVVFMQGCPMRCLYCHNPDTWNLSEGKQETADAILERLEKNKSFYRKGGLTVTGGEPLLQMDFVTELFQKAKEKGIHTCLDTSGILFQTKSCKKEKLEQLLAVTDLILLDIKHIDEEEHRKLTGHSNGNVLAFLSYLNQIGKPVWIRHVVVPGITYEEKWLKELGLYLKGKSNIEKIEVLPYHSMGAVKYENLGISYPLKGTPQLTKEEAKKAENLIKEAMK